MKPYITELIDPEICASLIKTNPSLLTASTDSDYSSGIKRNLHLNDKFFYELITQKNILDLVASHLGNDFYLWRSVFWNLSPGQAGQNYHQDVGLGGIFGQLKMNMIFVDLLRTF